MKPSQRIALIALALAGIVMRAYTIANLTPRHLCGSDFPVFYAAGELAGTPELYSPAAVQKVVQRELDCTSRGTAFIRLPYFAGMMAPWARLPFWSALWLWRIALISAVAVFVWLWPVAWEWSLLACAWSLPVAYNITQGQDSAYLLLWLPVAVALLASGHDFAAGLALAMLTAKFHLFLLLPLLFLRRPKVLGGGAVGGAALVAVGFLLQGRHWMGQFFGAIRNPAIDPNLPGMFNLNGISHGNVKIEILLAVAVVAAVIHVIRHADFELGLAAVLAGSLLVGHHETHSDLVLLIPPSLTLAFHPRTQYSKVLAVFLISPLAYFLAASPGLWEIPRLLLLLQIFLLAWEVSAQRAHGETGSQAPVSDLVSA